jgi:hypothetical protein
MNYSLIKELPLEDRPFQLDEHGPVFILGCPRSGTTFLSHCIGALPGFREYVGVLAPPRLMHLVGALTCEETQQRLMLSIRDIFWQTFWRDEFFRKRKIALFLEGKVSLGKLVSAPSMNSLVFCYKEPFLCFAASHFAAHFPNSRFIHIIRDGRDNADSMCRTYGDALNNETLSSDILSTNKVSEIGFWNRVDGFNYPWYLSEEEYCEFRDLSPFGRYVRLWREMTENARALSSSVPCERYLEVRYERIVDDPTAESDKINEFLGRNASSSFKKKLRNAHSKSIGISKSNQTKEKLDEAHRVAGSLLNCLGYE